MSRNDRRPDPATDPCVDYRCTACPHLDIYHRDGRCTAGDHTLPCECPGYVKPEGTAA